MWWLLWLAIGLTTWVVTSRMVYRTARWGDDEHMANACLSLIIGLAWPLVLPFWGAALLVLMPSRAERQAKRKENIRRQATEAERDLARAQRNLAAVEYELKRQRQEDGI